MNSTTCGPKGYRFHVCGRICTIFPAMDGFLSRAQSLSFRPRGGGSSSADRNLAEDGRLFRVLTREILASGNVQRTAFQREDLAATLVETFPEVYTAATRIRCEGASLSSMARRANYLNRR